MGTNDTKPPVESEPPEILFTNDRPTTLGGSGYWHWVAYEKISAIRGKSLTWLRVPDMTVEEARAVFTPDYGFNVIAIEDACHFNPAAVLVLLAAALQKQEAPDAAHSKNT